jgi:hypothetical protein
MISKPENFPCEYQQTISVPEILKPSSKPRLEALRTLYRPKRREKTISSAEIAQHYQSPKEGNKASPDKQTQIYQPPAIERTPSPDDTIQLTLWQRLRALFKSYYVETSYDRYVRENEGRLYSIKKPK